MNPVEDILTQIPVEQLAQEVGANPAETEQAIRALVPEMIGSLQKNAMSPEGEQSLAGALDDHAARGLLDGGVDISQVDPADGEKLTQPMFGHSSDEVAANFAGGSSLISKLLPLLAPIVLAYLARRMGGGRSGGGGGLLDQILGGALGGGLGGGMPQQTPQQPQGGQMGEGNILSDMLGSILGGGAPSFPADANPGQAGGSPFDPAPTTADGAGGMTPPGHADGQLRMDDGSGMFNPEQQPADQQAEEQPQQRGGIIDAITDMLGGGRSR